MTFNPEIIRKVNKYYVGDDCVQVMTGYRGCMLLLGPDQILYHDQANCDYINKYLDDERRTQFPYSNIPYHYQRNGFKKVKYVNQLIDFDKPYLKLSNNGMVEIYAIKDRDSAFVVSKICMHDEEQELLLSRAEIEDYFALTENRDQLIIYEGQVNGGLEIPSNEDILSSYKATAEDEIGFMLNTTTAHVTSNLSYQKYARLIESASIESVPENAKFMADDIMIIRMQDGKMTLKNVTVRFMAPDCYKVYEQLIPLTTYTLDQIKSRITKAKSCPEPKIPLRLNSEIAPEEIVKARRLVKNYGGFCEASGE